MSELNSLTSFELQLFDSLKKADITQNLVVALSGGLDSKSLLHALVRLHTLGLIGSLKAIHINHGLQVEAEQWAEQCQLDCNNYKVELISAELKLNQSQSDTGTSNIESKAREGRYNFFESTLRPEETLLMAHHQDDQAETLLFRLLRGCGISGAGAMPVKRQLGEGQLFRPLLNTSRIDIQGYAKQKGFDWLEDPSNREEKFARNFLRHQIMPKLKYHWPAYAKTLSRFSLIATEQTLLLEEVAAKDNESVSTEQNAIKIDKLTSLSILRQKNLLHFWGRNNAELSPSSAEVEQVLKQLNAAKRQSIEVSFAGLVVRSFAGELLLSNSLQPQPLADKVYWPDLAQDLILPNGLKLMALFDQPKGLRLPKSNESVWVDKRRGGEKCLPDYRGHSAEIKKIYQELAVPPWKREWLPVIYFNNELVAVPGVFVVKAFQSQVGCPSFSLSIESDSNTL